MKKHGEKAAPTHSDKEQKDDVRRRVKALIDIICKANLDPNILVEGVLDYAVIDVKHLSESSKEFKNYEECPAGPELSQKTLNLLGD